MYKISENEWKNTVSVINWLKNVNDKRLHKFLKFHIKDFHPSVKDTLLHEAIKFPKEHVLILLPEKT